MMLVMNIGLNPILGMAANRLQTTFIPHHLVHTGSADHVGVLIGWGHEGERKKLRTFLRGWP
jgi:hypothetical protein